MWPVQLIKPCQFPLAGQFGLTLIVDSSLFFPLQSCSIRSQLRRLNGSRRTGYFGLCRSGSSESGSLR